MANWTVATMFERLSEVLEEERVIDTPLLDMESDQLADISMERVVDTLRDRIVRDQFSPKAKAQSRAAKATKPKPDPLTAA